MRELRKLSVVEFLEDTGACSDGADWARQFPSMADVWDALAGGQGKAEWFLWLATRQGLVDERTLRLLACRLARTTPLADGRTVWDLMTDPRSRAAIEAAERHARGEITDDELEAALSAALSAARSAAWSAAEAARSAARSAAWSAARSAAWSAARSAAWSAAEAARSAALSAARSAAEAARSAAEEHARKITAEMIPNPFRD